MQVRQRRVAGQDGAGLFGDIHHIIGELEAITRILQDVALHLDLRFAGHGGEALGRDFEMLVAPVEDEDPVARGLQRCVQSAS